MKKLTTFLGAVSALLMLLPNTVFAEYGLNMTQGVTSLSHDIYDLHMMIFWICVVIGVIVFGAMFYSIFNHRKSKGAKAAHFHESTMVELIWTGVPILVLILMAIPATRVLIDLENTEKAQMTVKITGHQWKWQYDYPKEKISFISNMAQSSKDAMRGSDADREAVDNYLLEVDNRLVLPVDTRIRFLITSNDVIHSWWVRDFGVKQDANPGFINDAWAKIDKIGIYRGQCAELCGKDHGFMPIVVEVVSQADFKKWVISKQKAKVIAALSANKMWSKADLMAKGKTVYNTNCASCHKKDGSGIPPVFPAMIGSVVANGSAKTHIHRVVHGKGAMPAFKMLGDSDLAAVITYERNAFGNKGSIVQPADIKSAR